MDPSLGLWDRDTVGADGAGQRGQRRRSVFTVRYSYEDEVRTRRRDHPVTPGSSTHRPRGIVAAFHDHPSPSDDRRRRPGRPRR